ncbi:MAG: thiamine phosphate synthase [Lachnospiraceae bacterium]
MKINKNKMQLYAITDRTWLNGRPLVEAAEDVLAGGATMLQLREKDLDAEKFLAEAVVMQALCQKYRVPLIINDNVEIALKCNAAGVHLGQEDLEAKKARQILGEDKIIGVSAKTLEDAKRAEESGADYLGVGAVFGTTTKKDATPVSFGMLQKICQSVSIPVVAIGGITAENVKKLYGSGVNGVAVISALFAQKDCKKATQQMFDLTKKFLE